MSALRFLSDLGVLYRQALLQSRPLECFQRWGFCSDPLELSRQWHLWTDGLEVVSMIRQGRSWCPGPEVTSEELFIGDRMGKELQKLLGQVRGRQPLGVVVHLSDEFSLAPIRKRMDSPEHYESGTFRILDDPQAFVEERITGGFSYRYLPLAGSRSALAVKVPIQMEKSLAGCFEVRSRIRFSLRCGVLELLAYLVRRLPVEEELAGDGRVIVLGFPRYSVMAVINKEAGLASLATLPHGSRTFPADIGFRVAGGLKQASIESGTVWVVQASDGSDWKALREDIDHYLASDPRFADSIRVMGLPVSFFGKEDEGSGDLGLRPEMTWEESPMATKPVFGSIEDSEDILRFAGTNFSTAALHVAGQRISKKEAYWLLGAQLFQGVLTVSLLTGAAFFVVSAWGALRSEAWNLPEADFLGSRKKAASLDAVHASWEQASQLLQPRSQAWSVMELVARIFPEEAGTRLQSIVYELHPHRDPGARSGSVEPTSKQGFLRVWKLTGMADGRGETFLDQLGKERVTGEFMVMAGSAEGSIFGTDKRDVASTVERQPQPMVQADDGRAYGARFSVMIEQRIHETDSFALPVGSLRLPSEQMVRGFLP